MILKASKVYGSNQHACFSINMYTYYLMPDEHVKLTSVSHHKYSPQLNGFLSRLEVTIIMYKEAGLNKFITGLIHNHTIKYLLILSLSVVTIAITKKLHIEKFQLNSRCTNYSNR